MAAHEEVLRFYDVSAVHLAKEVAERITAGTFSWKQFGGTHPKRPGNALCADLIGQMLHHAWRVGLQKPSVKATVPHPLPEKLFNSQSYVAGRFLSPEKAKRDKGWKWSEPNWKKLSGGKRGRYLGLPLLHDGVLLRSGHGNVLADTDDAAKLVNMDVQTSAHAAAE